MATEPSGYLIQQLLHSSPNSRVYRGIRESDQAAVILRTCSEAGATPGCYTRLAFTHQILQLLNHPNVIRALDWVEDPHHPWLIMEDIQGDDLRQFVKRFEHEQLPLETFLKLVIQLTDALGAIHQHQVIHKDLHPGNLIVNAETLELKIIDFGLASLWSRDTPTLAAPELLEGDLSYMSPEQTGRMNRYLDYRSDFYTVGITSYQLLTGQLPFTGEDALGIVYAQIAHQQTAVWKKRPDVSQTVSEIIDRLLQKNPEDRYQSARGIHDDLERCLSSLHKTGVVAEFEPGQTDVSEHLHIPQILYGREQEIQQLLSHFQQAAQGLPQLLAVCGYPGIGKSSLVQEIHKPIAAHNGVFIHGKFEQSQLHTPYFALISAFKIWLQQTVSLTEPKLMQIRSTLLESLGDNARVLIDFMAGFQDLLGELKPVPKLGAQETLTRFHLVMQKFITTMTREQPWVIFLDDLQWADTGTLHLIPELLGEKFSCLMIIVAFRDNEVDEHHPVTQMLTQIASIESTREKLFSKIVLEPLHEEQVQNLLTDTLYRTPEEVIALARLVHQKAGGNPFFTIEFLNTLYQQNFLSFKSKPRHWEWEIEAIRTLAITDNVVDLMLDRMQTLPEKTQSMLKNASCLGNNFDLATLALVAENTMTVTARLLWPAMELGLLVQTRGDMLLGILSEKQQQAARILEDQYQHKTALIPRYHFQHDRVLQAAYESVDKAEQQQIHLKIGRLLFHKLNEHSRRERMFEIVNHFNKADCLIDDPQERLLLAELNLSVAVQARQSSVWLAATNYAQCGRSFLPENAWKKHHTLCFELLITEAENNYLIGAVEISEKLYQQLLLYTVNDLQKAEIYSQRMVQLLGRAEFESAARLGLLGLECLGKKIPTNPPDLDAYVTQLETAFEQQLGKTPMNGFHELPLLDDPQADTSLGILVNLGLAALIRQNQPMFLTCTLEALLLTLKSGLSDLSAVALVNLGLIRAMAEDYELAYLIGQEALQVTERFSSCRQISSLLNGLAIGLAHLKNPLSESIEIHRQGCEAGLANGELARAAVNKANILLIKLIDGTGITHLQAETDQAIEFCKPRNIYPFHLPIMKRYAQSMLKNEYQLSDDSFSAPELEVILKSFFSNFLLQLRLHFAFWSDQPLEKILTKLKAALQNHQSLKAYAFTSDLYFMACVIYLKKQANDIRLSTRQESSNRPGSQAFEQNHAALNRLNQCYSPNHTHKLTIIKALQATLNNEPLETICHHYQKAINSALKHGFIQYAALANEYYGEFLQQRGLHDLAEGPLQKAFTLYQQWGCKAKTENLPARFEFLKSLIVSSDLSTNNLSSGSSSSRGLNTELDFASLIKSAQAISAALSPKDLIETAMIVLMENAGAQLGILVFMEQGIPCIKARIDQQQSSVEIYEQLELPEQLPWPASIINLALRSGEPINLADAAEDGAFTQDQYIISRQPRSVLCLPITLREQRMGAIYLENNLTTAAFSAQRLDTLQTLLSQTAISMENTRLFEQISELNQGLEQKVSQRTLELNLAIQELESFNYTVSHDLRAPVRRIRDYSQMLQTEYGNAIHSPALSLIERINKGADKMNELINGLLELARVQRLEVHKSPVHLSAMVEELFKEMRETFPAQQVMANCQSDCWVLADERMLYSAFENLINNAWKYSAKTPGAQVHFGKLDHTDAVLSGIGDIPERITAGYSVYFIRDNGAGFDMNRADQLFGSFKRLHSEKQFEGTGIGLATVKRVIEKHGGHIWATAHQHQGATFYLTLPDLKAP